MGPDANRTLGQHVCPRVPDGPGLATEKSDPGEAVSGNCRVILGSAWTGGQLPSQVGKVLKLGVVWVQFTSVTCLFNIHGASHQAA